MIKIIEQIDGTVRQQDIMFYVEEMSDILKKIEELIKAQTPLYEEN